MIVSTLLLLLVLAVAVATFLFFVRLALRNEQNMRRALYFGLGFVFFAWLKFCTQTLAHNYLTGL